MSIKVSDIIHENGKFWVMRSKEGYQIAKNKGTHSICVGFEFPLDADGLSNAKAYCDYRAKKDAHGEWPSQTGEEIK